MKKTFSYLLVLVTFQCSPVIVELFYSTNTGHFHHCRKFYWAALLWQKTLSVLKTVQTFKKCLVSE
jgi:hypothetical protein